MKMLENTVPLIDKYFKTMCKKPEWLDSKILKNRSVRYLQLGSVLNFCKFMSEDIDKYKDKPSMKSYPENNKNDYWAGTKDWDSFLDLLENGDENVMKQIKIDTKKAINDLYKKYEEVIVGYKFDVTGMVFDIGLVLTGVPEVWLEPEVEEEEKPRVTIRIDGGFLQDIKSSDVVKNSARIIAIGKVLEDMGVQVQVEQYNFQIDWKRDDPENEMLVTSMVLKAFDEPINYKKLSSVVTPAYFRRGFFKIMETLSEMSLGYGRQEHLGGFVRIDDSRAIDRLEKTLFGGKK